MKLNDCFIQHQFDGQTVIIPTAAAEFHGLIQGNQTLAVITQCLMHDTTEEEIVNALCARYNGDRADMETDVAEAVRRLKEIGAIDE